MQVKDITSGVKAGLTWGRQRLAPKKRNGFKVAFWTEGGLVIIAVGGMVAGKVLRDRNIHPLRVIQGGAYGLFSRATRKEGQSDIRRAEERTDVRTPREAERTMTGQPVNGDRGRVPAHA